MFISPFILVLSMSELYKELQKLSEEKNITGIKELITKILEDNSIILYEKPLFVQLIPSQNLPVRGEYIGKAIIINVYYPSWKINIEVSEKHGIIGQPLVEPASQSYQPW